MKKLEEALTNLDSNLQHSLKCALASIHKIKHDTYFDALVSSAAANPELVDAHYIVYSNFNNVKACTFLDKRGARLTSGIFPRTDLTYDELDFEIDYLDLTADHPFKVFAEKISVSSLTFL